MPKHVVKKMKKKVRTKRPKKVVKTTVYLSDMGNFAEMNTVYAEHFGDHRPARATVQAAGLPKAVDVEIDLIAKIG